MLRVLLTVLATALFAGAVSLSAPASAEEHGPQPERVVAVGDLHGDFAAWQAIAETAGLVDDDGDWSGGETVFVQLGDVTDRGPHSRRIIEQLRRLQRQAPRAGGKVILLIGNHEAMNVIGDLRYVHPGEYAAFVDRKSDARREAIWQANEERIIAFHRQDDPSRSESTIRELWLDANPPGMLEHRRAWRPGGELGKWAAALPAIARVGDTLFVHGGVSAERGLRPLATINAEIGAALAEGPEVDRSAVEDPLGPLWYRGNLSRGADEADRLPVAEELAQVLAYHGAKRLVVGHTPAIEGIASSLGGRLVQVDTGISAHYNGPASFLEITPEAVIAHERAASGAWVAHPLDPFAEGDMP